MFRVSPFSAVVVADFAMSSIYNGYCIRRCYTLKKALFYASSRAPSGRGKYGCVLPFIRYMLKYVSTQGTVR